MNDKDLQNVPENLSADERKINRLLKSLPRAEAPKDFDFHLKARLARAPQRRERTLLPWSLRFALPVAAFAVILSALALSGVFAPSPATPDLAAQRPASETTAPAGNFVSEAQALPVAGGPPSEVALAAPSPRADERPKVAGPFVAVREARAAESPRKSLASAAKIQNEKIQNEKIQNEKMQNKESASTDPGVLTPILDPNPANPKPEAASAPKTRPVGELLEFLGAKSSLENGRWRVQSVAPNSLAERSGVKADDVVEAINDRPVAADTVLPDRFESKTVTVRRAGARLDLVIKNR